LNLARQFRARDGNLLSGSHFLKRESACLDFIPAHNQSEACSDFAGGLQRLLQTKALVAQFRYHIMTPQLVRDLQSQGQSAREADSIDDIVAGIAKEHRPGDLVVLMSNGGFGGIHQKLLRALDGAGRAS